MSELHDPPLRLTIEGMRWMGGESWTPAGTSATCEMFGTDSGDPAALLRMLRALAATRLRAVLDVMVVTVADLDFDAPNAPTLDDMGQLEAQARSLLQSVEVLRELAPEVVDDDDDDGEDAPDPSPAPEEVPSDV